MDSCVLVFSANSLPDPVVHLTAEKTSIGRAPDCQISFPDNKLISSRHCDLLRGGSGIVTLVDHSTNGTIINGVKKLKKNEKVALNDGDVVYLVKKKSTKDDDISFVFHAAQSTVDNQTMAYTADLDEVDGDRTPPVDIDVDDETVAADATLQYAAHGDTQQNGSLTQVIPLDDDGEEPTIKMPRLTRVADDMREAQIAASSSARIRRRDSNELLPLPARLSRGSTLTQIGSDSTQSLAEEATEDAPAALVPAKETNGVAVPVVAKQKSENQPGPSHAGAAASAKANDKMEEMLVCAICCEIIHDCVSLTPCSHKFCAGCYSDWMSRSRECPVCRLKVNTIARDHQFNAVIETYLQANPAKQRSQDDLKELDRKNKITADTVAQPTTKRRKRDADTLDDDDEDDDEDDYESDESETDEDDAEDDADFLYNGAQGFGAPAARFLCRSCPGYAAQAHGRFRGANVGQLASGEQFRCKPNQNHLLCQCCLEPMPDRRTDQAQIAIKCQMCSRFFCDQYWAAGCGGLPTLPNCSTCSKKFQDMIFEAKDMDGILFNNRFESDIFKNAIENTPESDVNVLFSTCVKKAIDGQYKFKYIPTADTVVCKDCAKKELAELAYQYRVNDIPNDRLPNEVRNRDDCWWGRNCTTQRKNPDHARRLNHSCEQTRRR